MPKVQTQETSVPQNLRAFDFHGVDFTRESGDQSIADCPLCGKEMKFHVGRTTGKWDCKSCGKSGNPTTFLRELYEVCASAVDVDPGLLDDRKLIDPQTLIDWGVRVHIVTGEVIVPGYGSGGKLDQLYRYVRNPKNGKRRLYPTPGVHEEGRAQALFGVPPFAVGDGEEDIRTDVYICEGPWDGMALYELFRMSRWTEGDNLEPTDDEGECALAAAIVIAVPGANVFSPLWLPLCAGKRVFLLYDNDHVLPHPQTGKPIPSTGYEGMKRVAGMLACADRPPSETHYLCWGKDGFDADLPHGYDIRDAVTVGSAEGDVRMRLARLSTLLRKVVPVPKEWTAGKVPGTIRGEGSEEACLECSSWNELVLQWRKAMAWHAGLDRALAFMLSVCASTEAAGDQLWGKVIGPPSCGKSVLCEALSINKRYVYPKDTLSGLTSGYQSDKEGSEDQSLAPKLRNKTLVINDADTILQLPNLQQILSQLRTFYGRNIRSSYGNKMGKNYEGINATVLLCGTSSIHRLDSSELGERFLDTDVVGEGDIIDEEETALRVVYRALRETTMISDGKPQSRDVDELATAKRLTGGYVGWLRRNAHAALIANAETITPEAARYFVRLGQFVSAIRARPPKNQTERIEKEMCYRLSAQLTRLATCMALVLNRTAVDDDEVLSRVRRVAIDTARGRTLEIVKHLSEAGYAGLALGSLAGLTNHPESKERELLVFLARIGVVESYQKVITAGVVGRRRWRLTNDFSGLYREVVGMG